jgi:predicted NBD/HSP70 family sugar kinase
MNKNAKEVVTKSENIQAVYRYIFESGSATRQELYIGSGLSLPTIKLAIEKLEGLGLIEPSSVIRNTGGRNAISYSVKENGRTAIGLYFSGHHITAVCTGLTGQIHAVKRIQRTLDMHDEEYIKSAGQLVEDIKASADIPEGSLLGVGLAVPSLVSDDGETIKFGMSHDFTGITRTVLSRYIKEPTCMIHDSYAAGYAEVWNNPDIKNAFYLNLNSNTGGCLIINNRIFPGTGHLAGEIGHMHVNPDSGKLCYCGRHGCLETECSISVLDSMTNGSLEDFMLLLKEKNKEAVSRWDTYLTSLASAVYNLIILFDSPVIIGGYIGMYIDDHLEDLRQRVSRLDPFSRPMAEFVLPPKYRNESTAVGAAIQVLDRYIHSL